MKDLAKEDNFDTEDKTSNAKIRNKTYIRSEMENDQMLTPEILLSIFNTQIGANTPVFQVGDDLYFAHIKSTNIDEQVAKNIRTNSEKI